MEDREPGGKGLRDGKNDMCGALAAGTSWQVWARAGKSTRPRGGRPGSRADTSRRGPRERQESAFWGAEGVAPPAVAVPHGAYQLKEDTGLPPV